MNLNIVQTAPWINVLVTSITLNLFLFSHTVLFIYLFFKHSCLHFPSTTIPSPLPSLPPKPGTYPFGFVHGSFIHGPWWPFPYFPPLSLPSSPPVTASLFLISMSLVMFCLLACLLVCFVDQVALIGEIIWYLSFTTIISLSIMLSRSTHANWCSHCGKQYGISSEN